MATQVVEITRGTGVSGKYGETFTFTRKFKVRADSPAVTMPEIFNATGVSYGDAHPDFPPCLAMEFDISDADDVGLIWEVAWKYYVPPADNKPDDPLGWPADYWTASGSTSTIAIWKDKDGNEIVNSAGDPLEGLERESSDFAWQHTKFYANTSWQTAAMACSNSVNNAVWSGGAERTFKCAFKGATKKALALPSGVELPYWETNWEFLYRADNWDLKVWDVGFAQLVDDEGIPTTSGSKRAVILGQDKKPVRQPVALNNGMAKAAGEPPDELDPAPRVYPEVNFSDYFGAPP